MSSQIIKFDFLNTVHFVHLYLDSENLEYHGFFVPRVHGLAYFLFEVPHLKYALHVGQS